MCSTIEAKPSSISIAATTMSDAYSAFLARKARVWTGEPIEPCALPDKLFPFQLAIVQWAMRKGRAAIFADCGL